VADSGETSDPRDREIAELKARVVNLERQLAQTLRKLEESLRAQKRQAGPFNLESRPGSPCAHLPIALQASGGQAFSSCSLPELN